MQERHLNLNHKPSTLSARFQALGLVTLGALQECLESSHQSYLLKYLSVVEASLRARAHGLGFVGL